jgi:hypothetical protein
MISKKNQSSVFFDKIKDNNWGLNEIGDDKTLKRGDMKKN